MVLVVTMGVADALWNENNYPTDRVINAGSPQPWGAAEEVRMATANLVNGAGVWDSTVIVESSAAATSGRLWVGSGDAEVTVRNGGTGDTGFTALGGSTAGGSGHSTLNVDGPGSLWTGHSFYIGGSARSGSLNVTGGGTALADNFFCAQGAASSDVTISGAGSSLDATHTVEIGQVGPALITVEEGGMFTVGNLGTGLDVSTTGTLVFGLGNGSRIACTGNAVIDDGATIVAKPDSGFTPSVGVPYDLVTASVAVNANPNNLVLDVSALGATAAGSLALNPGGTALQLTLTDTGQEPLELTRIDDVNVVTFDFESVPGMEYGVESSTNLDDWVFTDLIVTGDGGTMSVFDPTGTDTNKSYRLAITGL